MNLLVLVHFKSVIDVSSSVKLVIYRIIYLIDLVIVKAFVVLKTVILVNLVEISFCRTQRVLIRVEIRLLRKLQMVIRV